MKKFSWAVVVMSLMFIGFVAGGNAAEIIYQDDITQNVVSKDVLVRTADNIIVLIDASKSMGFENRKYKKTEYVLEKDALATGSSRLPDLGYNVGIYTHSPSWQEIYPMQKFDAAKVSAAMKQLPAQPSGNTYLAAGLDKLEGVLKGLSGKTVVYLFSDGGWENARGRTDPGYKTAELAGKYNVSFMVVSYAQDPDGVKRVKDMSRANANSRLIPFDSYITNPYYASGPLYYAMTVKTMDISSKKKIRDDRGGGGRQGARPGARPGAQGPDGGGHPALIIFHGAECSKKDTGPPPQVSRVGEKQT